MSLASPRILTGGEDFTAELGHSADEVDSMAKLPTTLSPLLTSNDPPTKLQTEQISAIESKLLSSLHNVNDQINEYEKGLNNLRAKQKRLLSMCKEKRSLIRSLPDELISKIFLECIPDGGVTISPASIHEAPMVLCQVCSRWRAIAFTTPQLWNRLTTTIGQEHPSLSYSAGVIDLMLDWFDRAKSLPLALRFMSHLPHFTPQLTEEAQVPDTFLRPLMHRLRNLDLALAWTPRYLGSLSADSHFHQLESLVLGQIDVAQPESWYAWTSEEPLVTFQSATRLRRVAMYYPIFGDNIGSVVFPWTQLTHFIVSERISHDVLEDLLRNCVSLQQGIFHLLATPYSVPEREEKTVQTHLVDLTITMDLFLNPGILRNFEFPALRNLRLGPLVVLEEHWGERRLLYPHLASVRRLSFEANYMRNKTLSCDRIVELLHEAPNVEVLDLCPGIFYPDLLEVMTIDTSAMTVKTPVLTVDASAPTTNTPAPIVDAPPTPILPKLHTLSVDLGVTLCGPQGYWERLDDTHPRRFSASALGKMVKSRWVSGGVKCREELRVTCLKELRTYLAKEDRAISAQIQEALRECVDEGLVVDERSADVLRHWSARLKDEEISWREGLSVLVSEYKY